MSEGGRLSVRILKNINSRCLENLIFGVKVAKIVNSLKNVSIFVIPPLLLGSSR